MIVVSSLQPIHENFMSQFHSVCKVDEVPTSEGKTVAIGNKLIALFNVDGEIKAIDDLCPHMGASLAGGYIENGIVTCPWHAWRFRLSDGAWADNPRLKVGCYHVRVQGGEVLVQFPPEKPHQDVTEKTK